MYKYEIMLILDPKADVDKNIKLVEGIFKKANVKKAEKMAQTELAYKINHSLNAQYLLFEIQAEPELIAEFIRRVNITKDIWRHMIINLDKEKGYGKVKKVRPNFRKEQKNFEKKPFVRDENSKRTVRENKEVAGDKEVKAPRAKKAENETSEKKTTVKKSTKTTKVEK